MHSSPRRTARPRQIALCCTWLVIAAGVLELTGVGALTPANAPPMSALTALSLALMGMSLLLIDWTGRHGAGGVMSPQQINAVATALAASVAMLAAVRLGMHVVGWPLDIDGRRFTALANQGAHAAHASMSPATAAGALLLACALVLAARRRHQRQLQWLAIAAFLLGGLGTSRYLYGGRPLAVYGDMALSTAGCLLMLSAAVLLIRPRGELPTLLLADTAGGAVARRLLPAALAVPLVAGWVLTQALHARVVGSESGLSVFAWTNVAVFCALIWVSARRLDRVDRERQQAWARVQDSRAMEAEHARLVVQERHTRELDAARAERSKAFNEALPAMMHSIDGQGLIVAVSDTWLDKLGYSRAEVLGRPSTDFLSPASRELARTVVLPEFFRTGRCDNVAYQMLRSDGRSIEVLLSAVLERDAQGNAVRSLAVIEDVSALHARQAELAQAQIQRAQAEHNTTELESLLAEREEMLRVLAHEVRQPLNNASAALQSAQIALARGTELAAAAPLQRARHVLAEVTAGLDNTLAVATLLAAGQARAEDTDIDTLIAIVLSDVDPTLRERVRVERTTSTRTAAMDPGLLRLALRNLVSNALAYSAPDSRVVVRILDSDAPLALVFEVDSAGPAIAQDLVPRLFQRGVRGRTHPDRPGGGLGLHIVRRVMELHGGTVALVHNSANEVRFRLLIPQGLAGPA